MARIYGTLALLLSWTVATLAADNATNHIYEPSGITNGMSSDQNRVYVEGSQYPISWTTSTKQPYVVALWQYVPGAGYANDISDIYTTQGDQGSKTINWYCVISSANLSISNIFYVELRSDDVSISSHYFNISRANTISSVPSSALASSISGTTTTSSMSSAASTSSQSITAASTTGISSSTSSPDAAPTSDSSTSKVGLGVGVGIGISVLLILAICAGIWMFRRRRASKHEPMSPLDRHEDYAVNHAGVYAPMIKTEQLHEYAVPHIHEKSAETAISEVPATREPVELPSDYHTK